MADLQDRGVDVYDREMMRSRPWPWLESHILGLLSADTRLRRALTPDREVPALPEM